MDDLETTINSTQERLTLRKGEKLRHRSLVKQLFDKGNTTYAYPLRMVWRPVGEEDLHKTFCGFVPKGIGSLQMMIAVPKKKRRHAVDRVLMRRRIREAYRLNRLDLKRDVSAHPSIRTLSISFVYIADKNEPYSLVERRMNKLLNILREKVDVGNDVRECHDK
ncbi:MAG: ribonuclease P protein component [Prevotella sp.]|nr:ribonuclease P protein component [Bacteroides sp.]MCM1366540.1 ribonuclease P protein component [Prevotella sp.]MCM1436850.1 ribonuclease P protein component [Prevotella sp.]